MARVLGFLGGKLLGLLRLSRESWEAIEADLLSFGFTLADIPKRVSWRAIRAHVTHARQGTALFHHNNGEQADWTVDTYLLALVVDLLKVNNWMRTKDAQHGHNVPKPLPRPKNPHAQVDPTREESHYGSQPMSPTEFQSWWANKGA